MNVIVARWQKVSARFSKLNQRERMLVAAASLSGIFFICQALLIDPVDQQSTALAQKIKQQHEEITMLTSQVSALGQQVRDPDAPNRVLLETAKTQLKQVEGDLHQFDGMLVQPSKMPRLLQTLLARHHGLELVALQTLPVSPLLPASVQPGLPQQTFTSVAQPAKPNDVTAKRVETGGIYKHGIEITVAGPYNELMAYVEELEHMSPRPLWSGMQLKVVEYPRSELKLTIYTLSLDLPWLVV